VLKEFEVVSNPKAALDLVAEEEGFELSNPFGFNDFQGG